MKCPVCRAAYRSAGERGKGEREREYAAPYPPIPPPPHSPTLTCHRCGVDLSPLIQLHDQAIGYHRLAIQAFQAGDYSAATTWNQQAMALYSNHADFHALAGQLWALQGEFHRAIAAWRKACQLNPQHPTATAYLDCLEEMA